MADAFFYPEDQYVLNYCTKYLNRFNTDGRNALAGSTGASRDHVAEAWRFPIVDSYGGGAAAFGLPGEFTDYNQVTFVYAGTGQAPPPGVGEIGTFANLYASTQLRRTQFEGEETRFWAVTYVVPKGQVHRYRFVIDGEAPVNDPVNPQQEMLDNGAVWSRFFTESFSSPVVLE